MGLVVGLAIGVMLGVVVTVMVCRRELDRMARFLRERPEGSNARLTVALPGRAWRRLAESVNGQLDAIQSERIALITHRQRFQRDMSALAHDVRTPLMGAQGHIQLALEDATDLYGGANCAIDGTDVPDASGMDPISSDGSVTPPAACASRSRHLKAALARLGDMRSLLDQLFAYARANDPDLALDVEPLEPYPLIAEILVGHYPEFEERGWRPEVDFADEHMTLDADRAALARIIDNLVVNALRHGASPPVITQSGTAIIFANGVAPAEAGRLDASRLFERFYQADDARGSQGSGLGLAVALSLARSMRMDLTAELRPAGGDNSSLPVLAITLAPVRR